MLNLFFDHEEYLITQENVSPGRVLAAASFFLAQTIAKEIPDGAQINYSTLVVMYDPKTEKTDVLPFCNPDAFLEEVAEAMKNGQRPIAVNIWDNEDHEFNGNSKFVDQEFICDDHSLEDEAILEGMTVCVFEEMMK